MVHTGGGGGGVGTQARDQHQGFQYRGDGGVRGHGGRGGSGIVLIQTNVAPPERSEYSGRPGREPASTKFTTDRFDYGIGS